MKAILKSSLVASFLGAGVFGLPSFVFAQAPAAGPAASAAPATLPAPAAPPANVAPAPAATAASSPPPLGPQAAIPAVAQVPAAPVFPMAEGEATVGQSALPAPRQRYLVPRVIAVQPAEPPEPPRPPKVNYPIGLELNFMPVWQTGPGYDLFSSNNISTRIGLAAELDLVDIADRTPLAIEVGWSTESQSGDSLGNALSADMTAHNLFGGLKLRHQLFSFLAPHLHAAAGATSLSLDYTAFNSGGTRNFESHDWLAFGFLGAGVTATIPADIVVRPGVTVEGGYLISESMPLRLEPMSQGQSIATSGATLGTLERSGPYLRFGLFLRY